ncbi:MULTISPECIES: diaminopimelate decarboxylase [Cytobacillus]|jgi:diaminopimelate decarboxylase|uniref:Diaminopimelate decarboxylase n=2 Tax=Cytobacillus TaxID=2675230 RepID=A0ABX3CTN7_9BACI|nr:MULTISPECIES: diaminopimelate decarboxylase [Cytobacillus]EFV77653.1 diaminopimelate decarboxylase [Bacillus sp. 2_A_57_CT2]MCM3405030.1 diaminopimelate decarboxylase [Cytobacillus oceanisediminis]MDK7664519.1 diaminopimelate decarboxylase [Cytobacillus oceanisediminis]OHX48852.1 diaminopimelate decarboxylase [Cytobacillus oceanisediminis]QOK24948.1 diaminopimelate decarboxylase [Cytobacillus oceanisediminis]
MFFHGTMKVNEKGHLEIGGMDTVDLAGQFGTPLYVYDVALIRERARGFKQTFDKLGIKAQVAYASKAFSTVAMVQLVDEEGLSLDVVSGGELYTALAADFPPERIHFHGNNKSREELEMALKNQVGCIVVDNFYELELLEEICESLAARTKILLRVTPGIEAHTHDYILTGQEDSKFGFDLQNGQAETALQKALNSSWIETLGLHCHIGSQIFDTTGFILAAKKIFEKMAEWKEKHAYEPIVLNLGGGFGIRYTEDDDPIHASQYVEEIIGEVKKQAEHYSMKMPEIWIEPGRSLVGDAGTTLYQTGSRKEVPNVRNYLAVDGGMSDNIRPALYQAKYEAVLANRVLDKPEETVSIAGKCCESGDMLIWDLPLPKAGDQDLLAVFCTGAYGYSMANNYNRIPRPPVVFIENGEAKLVVKRETYEDILRLDLPINEKIKN